MSWLRAAEKRVRRPAVRRSLRMASVLVFLGVAVALSEGLIAQPLAWLLLPVLLASWVGMFALTPRWRRPVMPYAAYLASEHWLDVRREALALAGDRCSECGSDGHGLPLEVHHLHYETLGVEDVRKDLRVLCRVCHRSKHAATSWRRGTPPMSHDSAGSV
jgi:hypothetical protein